MNKKEEVQKAREELKQKGLGAWFIDQLKSEWFPTKNNPWRPLQAIWTFSKWVFIFYAIFVIIQAVNFAMIYCESNVIEDNTYINAKFDWNNYISKKNLECQHGMIPQEYIVDFNQEFDETKICTTIPEFYCNYNLEKTGEETVKDFLITIKNNIKYKVPLWN